jgi:hypothetical protein
MGRIDGLANGVTELPNDAFVGFNSTEGVRRANDNTRDELRLLSDTVAALYRKLTLLETRIRDIMGNS